MTDAFRCDGCGEYYDQPLRFLSIEMNVDAVAVADFTLDDLGTGAYALLEDDHVADLCPDCGRDALADLAARFEAEGKGRDAVFEDRNQLACTLAAATDAPSGWTPAPDTDDDDDAWAIVWIESPAGQVSWHVPREMAEAIGPDRDDSYDYDGHSRTEKNGRLAEWARQEGSS